MSSTILSLSLSLSLSLLFSHGLLTVNATFSKVVLCHVEEMGVVEQRLGRNAADIQAGATELATLLNAHRLEHGEKTHVDQRLEGGFFLVSDWVAMSM